MPKCHSHVPVALVLAPSILPIQHNTGTTVLFLLLPGLLSHTPFSTLSLVTTPSSTCVTTPFQAQQTTHTKTRADKCYSTGVTTMKYLLLVLALQFTGLSFSIPRFTKLILTDLMSHPQSRFFVHLYLHSITHKHHKKPFFSALLSVFSRLAVLWLCHKHSHQCFAKPPTHQPLTNCHFTHNTTTTTSTMVSQPPPRFFPAFVVKSHTNCVTHSTKARKEKA